MTETCNFDGNVKLIQACGSEAGQDGLAEGEEAGQRGGHHGIDSGMLLSSGMLRELAHMFKFYIRLEPKINLGPHV